MGRCGASSVRVITKQGVPQATVLMRPRTSPTIPFCGPLTISATFINIMIVLIRIRLLSEENKITKACPKCVNSETGDDRKEWNNKKRERERERGNTDQQEEGRGVADTAEGVPEEVGEVRHGSAAVPHLAHPLPQLGSISWYAASKEEQTETRRCSLCLQIDMYVSSLSQVGDASDGSGTSLFLQKRVVGMK
ncbi:hypothetical protein MUK42_35895 [Musa troglodytarum]|uniref:Uncharacterized protein n=1 Tax=Musa troglodytarum TaxID=320322 RepID=A0A9E7G9R7_9LILI|nr:hypothetical protein MUK42_35895 [Musa troglodytarum]